MAFCSSKGMSSKPQRRLSATKKPTAGIIGVGLYDDESKAPTKPLDKQSL